MEKEKFCFDEILMSDYLHVSNFKVAVDSGLNIYYKKLSKCFGVLGDTEISV